MSLPVSLELTDLNGEAWILGGEEHGPVRLVLAEGLEGAAFGFDSTAGARQPGITVQDRQDKESYVTLTLRLGPLGYNGEQAVDWLREFLDGLGRGWSRGGRLMTLECLNSGRFQQVRLAEQYASPDWTAMSWFGRVGVFKIKLQSDESWWRTAPFDETYAAADFATATADNLGDVEAGAWPWFRLDGPITNPTLGYEGESVTLPSLAAGEWLEIETDPDAWVVRDQTGADRTWDLGTRWYKTMPARTTDVPITITGTGTTGATSLRVVVPQLFHGAL